MTDDDIQGLLEGMAIAWSQGDGRAFASHFSELGQFIAFDGSVHVGREAIAGFHQAAFDGPLKASTLRMRVHSRRVLEADLELVTTRGGVCIAGEGDGNAATDSVQTLILRQTSDALQVEALHNGRYRPIVDEGSATLWKNFDEAFSSLPR